MSRSRFFVVCAALLVAGAGAGPRALSAQQSDGPVIAVSARGEVKVVPDRASIQVAVETRATTAADAVQENAARQSKVIQALRGLGVRNDQIGTEGYSVFPETRNDKQTQTPHTVSYLVSNTIAVAVQDVATIGKLLDAVIDAGANNISSVSFYLSNPDSAYLKATALAVANARAQAQVAAAAAGGRLGPLVEMSTSGQSRPTPIQAAFRSMALASAETPIQAGEQTVSATVSGRWRFIPNQ